MMLFARNFVARRIAGHLDRLQPPFLHQRLKIAVDSGNPQRRMTPLRPLERLFRRQWPVGLDERLAYRRLLSRLSLIPDRHRFPHPSD